MITPAIIDRDYVLYKKYQRKQQLLERYPFQLYLKAQGNCFHSGKLSPGCETCFYRPYNKDKVKTNTVSVHTGQVCNVACGYCYYDPYREDSGEVYHNIIYPYLQQLYEISLDPLYDIDIVFYNSRGETLKYLWVIKEASDIIKRMQTNYGKRIYSILYTNFMLANDAVLDFLKECEVHEFRVHWSASHFSDKVMDNIHKAVEKGFTVSIEEPSLPECGIPLINKLDILEEAKVKHLNMIECQVTKDNVKYLKETYGQTHYMYRDTLWHLYDNGLVYDIMEEVLQQNKSFSIIDCNSNVENARSDAHMYIPEFQDPLQSKGLSREYPTDLNVDFYEWNKT